MSFMNLPFVLGFILIAFTPYYRQRSQEMNIKLYLGLLLLGAGLILWSSIWERNLLIALFDGLLIIAVTYDLIRALTGKLTSYEKDRLRKIQEREELARKQRSAKAHFQDPDYNDVL